MRFFLFSLFFYFNTLFLDVFNDFYNLKIDNILFSNDIRLNIDKIPHRNNLIIKKFDITKFNFKQKTKISNKFASTYTDSKIDNIKTKEKLVLARLPLLKDVNDVIFDNRPLLEKNENIYSSKNFKQIANNLEDSNKEPFVGLNILETINKAINYNPKIKAQKFSYESSKENIKQVYSAIFPSIEMNLSKGYKDTDSSTSDTKINESVSPQDFSINLEQNLYTGGKFTAEAKKAKSQLLIEEENLRLIRYEIILESALAYLNVLEKKKLIELNNLKEEKFKNVFKSIELLVKVGSASQSDLVFAQSKLVQTAAEKIVSINEFNVIKANYKKIVGEFLPNGNLEEPKINKINFPNNFDNAIDIAFKNNPKIKIAQLEENIAKFDIKSQFAESMPNITLDGEYQSKDDTTQKGSHSDTAKITAKITVPIFKGGKNISKIKQAKIIAKKVRYELENKRNEITQTVTKSWTDFQTSETLLKAANINIEARKLILEGIEQEAKLGIKSYIDLLQSKEELIDAEFNKITATKNYIISALQLKADIGELSLKDLYI
mgnify:CR=1 FL=1